MPNVILHYQDGSSFLCAENVTSKRAEEIKAYAEANKDDFGYRDVAMVEIEKSNQGGKQ
ncbi:hypothetical protein [Rodentibacter haemolyticus]|uniref:Uncharacterized protein n=1 Tax=Rodentibacter haemolyticus TaxID=2778911 RepID=A0ABX6UX40_9PAST|nr:hypothetical protein [Rodentibacter haemolyticus]QPB42672.1 hypothetical protein IHV77_00655 [Rodentibacter haemolyticus]